jgi:hypothetical protein
MATKSPLGVQELDFFKVGALTLPISGGRLVDIVRTRTQVTEFSSGAVSFSHLRNRRNTGLHPKKLKPTIIHRLQQSISLSNPMSHLASLIPGLQMFRANTVVPRIASNLICECFAR